MELYRGDSYTIGIKFNEEYDIERIQELELNIGNLLFGKLSDNSLGRNADDVFVCKIPSEKTMEFYGGKYKVTLHVQDEILGIKKQEIGKIDVKSSNNKTSNESINALYDALFVVKINETQITVEHVFRDLLKGDPFTYSDFTPEQLESLKVKGDPFRYEDFTPEQLEALKPEGINPNNMEVILWADLVALKTNNQLIPGTQYRITDYSTTTLQPNTLSAGHGFDIIVVADSTNKLNENARAVQRVGDTYFNSSKVEAWQLKYSLDNDTTRFAWADVVNGKGVIYKMIDENNNECPYDFKNIMFKRPLTSGCYDRDNGVDTWVYTFTWVDENIDIQDLSIIGQTLLNDEGKLSGIYDNKIKSRFASLYYESESFYALNDNVFISNFDFDSGFFYGCYSNELKTGCHSNTFGNGCSSNTFGDGCYSNTFGNGCSANTFGNYCYTNTFGNYCSSNTFGKFCYANTFGNGCSNNTFGNDCYSNTFGNGCSANTFGNGCSSNTFGDGCYSNTFGNDCSYNTFGDYCQSNTFGNYCYTNTFGNHCSSNTFGANIVFNLIGDSLRNIIAKNGLWGLNDSNKKDWTAVTALYNKDYPIEVWGYKESVYVATTNTYRYFNATGVEVKGTF